MMMVPAGAGAHGWGDGGGGEFPEHSLQRASLRRKAVPPLPSGKSEPGPQGTLGAGLHGRSQGRAPCVLQ